MNHSNSVKPKGNRIINILIFIGLMFLVSSPTMIAGSIIYSVVNHASLWIVIGITVLGIIWTIFIMWLFRWYYHKKAMKHFNIDLD